jgi:hypothetical protein
MVSSQVLGDDIENQEELGCPRVDSRKETTDGLTAA